jgi:hypothetical protein
MNRIKDISIVVLIALVGILFAMNSCNKEQLQEANNLLAYKNDTVQVYKDRYQRTVAEKRSLEVDSEREIVKLAEENAELKQLAEEIKKEKDKILNATIVKTKVDGVFVGNTDTVIIDSTQPCNPTYKVDIKEKWFEMYGFVNKEKYEFNPSFKGDIIVLNTLDRKLFKPNIVNTKVKFENPYFSSEDVQTFTTKCDCKKGFWFVLGVGTGFFGNTILRRTLL